MAVPASNEVKVLYKLYLSSSKSILDVQPKKHYGATLPYSITVKLIEFRLKNNPQKKYFIKKINYYILIIKKQIVTYCHKQNPICYLMLSV